MDKLNRVSVDIYSVQKLHQRINFKRFVECPMSYFLKLKSDTLVRLMRSYNSKKDYQKY